MKISAIRSDKVYSKIMNAPLDKKNDIYRYELMKPFEKKWACYSVPMKALTPNGYDVIMASIRASCTDFGSSERTNRSFDFTCKRHNQRK